MTLFLEIYRTNMRVEVFDTFYVFVLQSFYFLYLFSLINYILNVSFDYELFWIYLSLNFIEMTRRY